MNRRSFISLQLLLAAAVVRPLVTSLKAEEKAKIPIRLTIAADQPYVIPNEAEFEGRSVKEPSKGGPLITILVGLVLFSYLTDLIFDIYSRTFGTIIIDLRENKVSIHNIPGAAPEIIVVTDKGIEHFERSAITRAVVENFLEALKPH